MRTTKEERKRNARQFYQSLLNSKRAVVVVERSYSNNHCGCIARFKGVGSLCKGNELVLAENRALGKEGCFYEFFEHIKPIYPQIGCFEDRFKEWVKENYNINITYDDGYAMIWEV